MLSSALPRPIRARALLAAAVLAAGCSGSPDVAMPRFDDLSSAPAPIQQAARAVVRVETAGETATGSFISESGLLLTNDHVLGSAVCPREGCYVEITQGYQAGEHRDQAQILFAVPTHVDAGLDVAAAQIYLFPGGPLLGTPDHLTLRPVDFEALLGMHVTVVGHPEGALKKWTDGVVTDVDGSWFHSTAYILPGDSGSPALDDAGKLVGIVHRGPTGEDLFTERGANVYSIGTGSASIARALTAPLPALMISTGAPTTRAEVVENDRVWLNARAATATVESGPASVLAMLADACDAALLQPYASPGDLQAGLEPCYEATRWIECRADATAVSYGAACPPAPDLTAWAVRFQRANQCWRGMNGEVDLHLVSFGIAALSPSVAAGKAAGAESLQQALSGAVAPMDFELAYYLAAFDVPSWRGIRVASLVKAYESAPHYEFQATYVAAAASWLNGSGALTRDELVSILSRLHGDPRVSVGTKLYVERIQYALRVL